MKHRLIILLLLIFTAAPGFARDVYNFNHGWKFFDGRQTTSDNAVAVTLPHSWNGDATAGDQYYVRGVGNYLKDVVVPAGWAGRRVFIKCYGANQTAQVFVNGKLAGEHLGGSTAFCCEITDKIKVGQRNFFHIMVSNSARADVLPTAGEENAYGGLFRDVEIVVTGNEVVSLTDNASDGVYIRQKKVSAQRVEGDAVVRVNGTGDATVRVEFSLHDASGVVVAEEAANLRLRGRETATAAIPFALNAPNLWAGVGNPYLYTVKVRVYNGKTLADQVEFRTGFRSVAADPQRGFFLNGESYPLKGVIVHRDRPLIANALTAGQVAEDFALIREMGANAVRVFGGAHHPEFYRLCDEHGIIVWSDFPLVGDAYLADKGFINSAAFRANGFVQAADIVRQQYNHPSVAIWGVFSNLHARDDDPVEYVKALNEFAKKEDPSRLTAASSNQDGEINFVTDLVCWDHFYGWKEGQPSYINTWKRSYSANWATLCAAVSYGAGGSVWQQADVLQRPDWRGNLHPERWQTHLHEEYMAALADDTMFWGTFVANMFDFGAAGYRWGATPGVNDMGLVTYDRKDRKDSYYFYKANWCETDPFVYIADRRWARRRGEGQEIRVYTNLDEAELFVNGLSQGRREAKGGICRWNVQLKEGANLIEARSGVQRDNAKIEIATSPAMPAL
ncbi:glycoside hydrolase family 2 protein [Alistipes sp. OttesenSCG-928-B03]|nr:glycoside hydrolase family 2 protein [Alistipes sp. OttesenSCG-928-B03]